METQNYEIYNYADTAAPKIFPHKHNFFEIYYLLCDDVTYVIENQEYHPVKGDFLLVPPGLLHYPSEVRIAPGKSYARIVLWCNVDFFGKLAETDASLHHMWDVVTENRSYLIHPSAGDSARLYDRLLLLLAEQKQPGFSSDAMKSALLTEIFVRINRIIYGTKHFEKHVPSANLFGSIINYIYAHLSEELTLTVLSRQFFVSKGYISRLFREYTGITVHQYILSLRLEGCRKAIQSGTPITAAAEMYGFQDYSSFYRAFKHAFLLSPREYQNEKKSRSGV